MSAPALAAARTLWPAFRRLLIKLGRWVARRVERRGASWVAKRMRARANGFQTQRLEVAKRKGRKVAERFRTKQIKRWRAMAQWLTDNRAQLGKGVRRVLDRLAWQDRIPLTLPGEGWIR